MGTTTPATEPLLSPSVPHPIYNQIKTYPFSADPEFQSGLRAILSTHSLSSSEIRTRTLQAQCFYISRKNNIIPLVDVEGYVNWLRQSGEEGHVSSGKEKEEEFEDDEEEGGGKVGGGGGDDVKTLSKNEISPAATITITRAAAAAAAAPPREPLTELSSSATSTTTEAPPPPPPPPPYPQSFSHLVELITTGQPIPGIKEVPNTLLKGQGSKAVESKRRKPWEVHRQVEMEMEIGEGEMEKNGAGGAGGVAR